MMITLLIQFIILYENKINLVIKLTLKISIKNFKFYTFKSSLRISLRSKSQTFEYVIY